MGASNYSRCAASGILSNNSESTGPVCYGYATAFKVLPDAAGIPNAYVEGWAYNQNNWPSGEQHAWNYVQLNDGQWYAIDPTWDDPKLVTGQARFHYFLVGSQTVTETALSGKGQFGQNHEVTKSPANAHKLSYPTLSTQASDQVVTNGFELIQGGSSTKYDTLEAALNAAQSGGGTVKLWQPATITQTLTIPDGVTLDLNGQQAPGSTSLNAVAISGDISPLLSIPADSHVSIVNSSSFTAISTTNTGACIQNDGVLELGTNLKIARAKYMMGADPLSSPIGGAQPQYTANSYTSSSAPYLLFVHLVIQPTVSSSGTYQASGAKTVADLIQGTVGTMPTLTVQYYGVTGSPTDVPTIPPYTWSISRSPNNGNRVSPDDKLENGDYLFTTSVFGYPVTYTVTVSGVPDTPTQYTVTVNGGDGATGAGQYKEGEKVTVTAGTKADHTFKNWTAEGISLSNSNNSTVTFDMPDNDVTLTANFEPDAPVVPDQFTVTVNGGDGATGAGQYKEGEKVTVTAGTKAGYTFKNWTAEGISLTDSTKPTVTFDMPGNDVTLTANFEPDAPVIPDQFTVTVNGGDGATGAGQYKAGEKVTVTAGSKAGYTFTNWSASGVTLSNPANSTVTFDMPKNAVTLTANWTVYNPGGGSGSGSSGGSSSSNDRDDPPVSNSTVQKNPDGSTTTTVKKPNGSTTVTTTWKDGSKEVIQTQKDGTSTTTVSRADGTTATTTVNQSGRTEVKTTLSQSAVDAARKESAPLPISPLTPNSNPSKAPLVTVRLPKGSGTVKVEIPTKNLTMGTVAVLVQPDGTEHVLKTALPVENGMVVSLRDGETVKLVDKSRTYADVPTNYWGSDGIQFTASRELFTGTSASTFSPDTLMDRAMFWTVLARYDGVNTDGGPTWYQMGQVWAVNRGISDGAAPNNPITREQLVTMLYRYDQSSGQDVSARGSLSRYQDQGQVSSFAEEAMSWATAEGLLSGTSANTLSPGGLATRAEVAALLTRYCIWAA